MANKPGRPRATRPKDVRITVRFTEDEMRRIDAGMGAYDSYAAFIRACVLAYPSIAMQTSYLFGPRTQQPEEPTRSTIRAARRAARRANRHADPALEQAIADSLGLEVEWGGKAGPSV
jgi:hypothetical protein